MPSVFTKMARRKSSGNVFADVDGTSPQDTTPPPEPPNSSGGFRIMDQREVQRLKQEAAVKKQEKSKFGRFSGFGAAGSKARNQSFDDDSASSSKRDSKSSSGTQFSSNRPYNVNHYGSTSTLPSSADMDPNDNMFANLPPRPAISQHSSSPGTFATASLKKALPMPPKANTMDPAQPSGAPHYSEDSFAYPYAGRTRALTTSSYASTAIPPKLDTSLGFDDSGFDDLFSGLEKKESPPEVKEPTQGRSLVMGKRTTQAEPLKINPNPPQAIRVEPALKSWDSHASDDHLIDSSPTEENSPPPPVPAHKYAPVSLASPVDLRDSHSFQDEDVSLVRQSVPSRKFYAAESSPEPQPTSISSSAAPSLQTPLSSRSGSNTTTPKTALRHTPAFESDDDDDEDNLFSPAKTATPVKKPAPLINKENLAPLSPSASGDGKSRVMTDAEFKARQQYQMTHPEEENSDSDDYEDEEEAIEKREQEALAARKRQQMHLAREHIRRTTTAPGDPNRPSSRAGEFSTGFPSEISAKAEEWEDEDIPLAILQAHGFPSRQRPPTQPATSTPSYYRQSSMGLPERPQSAGAMSNANRASTYRPPFARNLPDDPHASFIGGGLVKQGNRESLGFNRGPASVHGGDVYLNPPMGEEPPMPFMSLVERIQVKDSQKLKYTGGASSKRPEAGPFTGMLAGQMNAVAQPGFNNRMSQMPMQQGLGMMGMGQPSPMGINMGMGMNQMGQAGYGMPNGMPNNDLWQMQQIIQMQQMQLQQMNQMQQLNQMNQYPGMGNMLPGQHSSMMPQGNGYLGAPLSQQNQRPMSVMSSAPAPPPHQQSRPFSTPTHLGGNPNNGFGSTPNLGNQNGGFLAAAPGPGNGYTPSIAPSERSNIGLSARYRPVVTGPIPDGLSTVSSQTLQASGGAFENKKVKGILKKPGVTPQITVREQDEDDDWGSLAARKQKYSKGKQPQSNGFEDVMAGIQ